MKLTAITDPTALSLDTTVGTRISAGSTMIYGDTGLRSVTSSLREGVVGSVTISRRGPFVTVSGSSIRPPNTGIVPIIDMPFGFRAERTGVGTAVEIADIRPVFALAGDPFTVEVRAVKEAQSWINFTITFLTRDAWPTTLPGLPA